MKKNIGINNLRWMNNGDVFGLSKASVKQIEPQANCKNFEYSKVAFIKFHDSNFIWCYGPGMMGRDSQVPWLTLIVFKNDEFTYVPKITNKDLPLSIIITNKVKLPNLAHTHIQLNNTTTEDNNYLLSTRHLEASTNYTAFVIPTFKLGYLTALGLSTDNVKIETLAWTEEEKSSITKIPYYYHWHFQTKDKDDLE